MVRDNVIPMDDETYDPRPCPECESSATVPTDESDEEGLVEFHCLDCGHYFVDVA
jgi:hypothetical protein